MKKLLAVVLSAAMVLGMSTVAMADAVAEPTFSTDGLTLYVNTTGEWNSIESSVTLAEDAVVVKQGSTKELGDAAYEQGLMGFPASNVDGNVWLFAAAYTATTEGVGLKYDGPAFYITFEAATTVTLPDGSTLEVKEEVVPTEAPTETPADPTEAPADPTEAPADPTQAPADSTQAPADNTVATKAPATTTNKTTAAKTADVAPVATMAVLALAAAAVVVAMKKRVTE